MSAEAIVVIVCLISVVTSGQNNEGDKPHTRQVFTGSSSWMTDRCSPLDTFAKHCHMGYIIGVANAPASVGWAECKSLTYLFGLVVALGIANKGADKECQLLCWLLAASPWTFAHEKIVY